MLNNRRTSLLMVQQQLLHLLTLHHHWWQFDFDLTNQSKCTTFDETSHVTASTRQQMLLKWMWSGSHYLALHFWDSLCISVNKWSCACRIFHTNCNVCSCLQIKNLPPKGHGLDHVILVKALGCPLYFRTQLGNSYLACSWIMANTSQRMINYQRRLVMSGEGSPDL